MIKWQIEKRNIDELKGYEKNPRKFTDKGLKDLKKSLENVGDANIITINKDNTVLGGHARLTVMKQLGYKEVDVKVPDRLLNDKECQEIVIRLNANTAGEWDFEKLEADFDTEELEDWGLNVDFAIEEEEKEIIEDEVPEEVETRCKLGDIWQLGEHRLMCGNSTKVDDVEKLMNGGKADMVFTDPPYNMSNNFDTSTINLKKLQKRVDDIVNFNPDEIAYLTQLNICSFYIFTSKNLVPRYFEIFKDFDFNILVWCKDNPTPLTNYTFLPDVEYLLYFSKKGKIWNNGLDTTIYKKYYNGNKLEGRKEAGDVHPTVKPQKIIQDKIQISSSINGVVLDIFGGSGSTLIACEQLNRKCYTMELDEKYCDVILQRWENLTGKKAVKIG